MLFGAETAYGYRLESTLDSVSRYSAPAGDVDDLSLLAHMPNLEELYLCQQAIADLSPLAGLELEVLALSDNQITDLSPLAGMDSLEELWLGGNPVADASPLAGLGRLRLLNLSAGHGAETGLDSLSFLAELPLDTLSLARRTVSGGDWFPLGALGALDELFLWSPPAEALEAAAGLDYLAVLEMGDAGLEDLTVLAGCPVIDLRIHGGLAGLELEREALRAIADRLEYPELTALRTALEKQAGRLFPAETQLTYGEAQSGTEQRDGAFLI